MTDAKQFSATLFLRHIVSRFSHLFSKSNCTLLLFVLRFEIRKKVIQIQVHFELNDQFKVHRGTVFEYYRKFYNGERSELRLHFELTKVNQNCQKLVENVQIEKLTNETFCVIFKHCGAEQKKEQQSRVVC